MKFPLEPLNFKKIVFFTGAGMSAESGVPTYRGSGGIWNEYRWQEYACQKAFDRDPQKVLDFHELRRKEALKCQPHAGHYLITRLQKQHEAIHVITQNIDGMHQRAGTGNVIELHGSLWRVRCPRHGVNMDAAESYSHRQCPDCGSWLRPDIIWFEDRLDEEDVEAARYQLETCDLFISIGTSAVVWPAAGYPLIARHAGAQCLEINPEPSENSEIYHHALRGKAGEVLPHLFARSQT